MKNNNKKYIRYIILGLAIASLTFGVIRGDMAAVFQKAAAICMECIGIG